MSKGRRVCRAGSLGQAGKPLSAASQRNRSLVGKPDWAVNSVNRVPTASKRPSMQARSKWEYGSTSTVGKAGPWPTAHRSMGSKVTSSGGPTHKRSTPHAAGPACKGGGGCGSDGI